MQNEVKDFNLSKRVPQMHISLIARCKKRAELVIIQVRVAVSGSKRSLLTTKIEGYFDDWRVNRFVGLGSKEKNEDLHETKNRITNIYNALKEVNSPYITAKHILDIFAGKATIHQPFKEKPVAEKSITDILIALAKKKFEDKSIIEEGFNAYVRDIEKIQRFFVHISQPAMSYTDFTYTIFEDFVKWFRNTPFRKKELDRPKKNAHIKKFTHIISAGNAYALRKGYTKTVLPKYERFVSDAEETEFLSAIELQKLEDWEIETFSTIDKIRDVFLFSCYTGFQWCDMKVFSTDFTELYNNEEWIIKPREKTGVKQLLPFFPKAKEILEKYKGVLPIGNAQEHTNTLAFMMKSLGINKHITNRCGRKTAGMVWLNSGISIEVVSKMLGHANIDTTQRHYATVLLERIDRETKHLRQTQANEPATNELKSLNELTEPTNASKTPADFPADFDKMVQMLADAVAQKIKVA